VLGDPATAYYRGSKTIGFGVAQPHVINQDPRESRGDIDLVWRDWGKPIAYAQGKECSASGDCRPVTVRVSHLGKCGGKAAYEDAWVAEAGSSAFNGIIIVNCLWTG
jgi:hypothetical protein